MWRELLQPPQLAPAVWNKCGLTLESGCEADGIMQEAVTHPHRGSCDGLQPCLSQGSGLGTLLLTFPSWGTFPSKSSHRYYICGS